MKADSDSSGIFVNSYGSMGNSVYSSSIAVLRSAFFADLRIYGLADRTRCRPQSA